MENYSQGQEQEYILKACEGIGGKDWIGEGKFLDIGAFHPEVFSNTRALFEKGWGGDGRTRAGTDEVVAG